MVLVVDHKELFVQCRRRGVLVGWSNDDRVRLVTRYGVSTADVERSLSFIADVAKEAAPRLLKGHGVATDAVVAPAH